MLRRTVLALTLALGTLSAMPALAAELAGKVSRVKGDASAVVGGTSRKLSEGEKIFVGETLRTGKDTRLEIVMIDEAKLTLGDNSRLLVETYLFNESANTGKGKIGRAHV